MMGRLLLFLYGMASTVSGSLLLLGTPHDNQSWVFAMTVLGILATVWAYVYAEFKDIPSKHNRKELKKNNKVTPIGIYVENPYDKNRGRTVFDEKI